EFNSPTEYNLFLEQTTELWVDHMKPQSFFAMENPVGRIAKLAGLPEPTLQFHPNMFGDPYTKRTQLWGKFNPNLPTAPVEATDGSKIQSKLSSKDKVERSTTPAGFAYAFFVANHGNAVNNPNFNTDETVQQTTTTGASAGQLRGDTETVSAGTPSGILQENGSGQNAESVSSRQRGSLSGEREGLDGTRDDKEPGRGNGVEHSYVNSGRPGENVEKNEALGGESGEGQEPKTGEATVIPDRNGRNFVIPPNFEHKKTFNPVQKLKDNLAAIERLYTLLSENREATEAERELLFKYVGFGGLKEVRFNPKEDRHWQTDQAKRMREDVAKLYDLAEKLKEVGINDAMESISSSALNAHYTSIPVIRGIYDAIDKIGFTGGRFLEPSMGTGHFLGAMPYHISKNTELFGVEKDFITGHIAKVLYPDARIAISGLEKSNVPAGYMDAVVSNIPFGPYGVYDSAFDKSRKPALAKAQKKIHNYFFAKAIETARPGGIIAFITTNGVLDSPENEFMRDHITKETEFLGAIRLPDHAFKGNAGTEVVTDVVFLRKFQKGEVSKQKYDISNIVFEDVPHHDGKTIEKVRYNEYFKTHPEMVIGEIKAGGQYERSGIITVVGNENQNLQKEISDRAAILFPEKIYKKAAHKATDHEAVKQYAIDAVERRKPGNIIITKKGMAKMVDRENAESWKPSGFSQKQVESFVGVRDALNKVIAAEISGVNDEGLKPLRDDLNREYDSYVKRYGQLSQIKNQKLLSHDIDGFNVGGLERYDDKAKQWVKADIFKQRTISPYKAIDHADNIQDALLASLGETGSVNIDRMAELMGKTVEEVVELGKGLIYEDPTGGFATADEYLSGPVRKKLEQAKMAAEVNPKFQYNVEALEKVIPADIKAVDIEARIGARWVGAEVYQQFARELFNSNDFVVSYNERKDEFTTDWRHETTEMRDTFGTPRINGGKLFDMAFQLKEPVIHDTVGDNKVVNEKETAAAIEKQQAIREAFSNWIWKDADRRERLG
ncbi:MAG TPA: hypothetical protein VFU05_01150, partial [Cyclobacteriaceae bacterium]|nr:hypothetical protein [Cyclobacteriaceae bacterium]